jgi:flagellar hook-length control protein FliK
MDVLPPIGMTPKRIAEPIETDSADGNEWAEFFDDNVDSGQSSGQGIGGMGFDDSETEIDSMILAPAEGGRDDIPSSSGKEDIAAGNLSFGHLEMKAIPSSSTNEISAIADSNADKKPKAEKTVELEELDLARAELVQPMLDGEVTDQRGVRSDNKLPPNSNTENQYTFFAKSTINALGEVEGQNPATRDITNETGSVDRSGHKIRNDLSAILQPLTKQNSPKMADSWNPATDLGITMKKSINALELGQHDIEGNENKTSSEVSSKDTVQKTSTATSIPFATLPDAGNPIDTSRANMVPHTTDPKNSELDGLLRFADHQTSSVTSNSSHISYDALKAVGTATPNSEQPIIKQITAALNVTEKGTIELRLDPAELGRVRISMVARDGLMQAIITAERPETLEMLRRNSDSLDTTFSEQGFENTELDFQQFEGDNDPEDEKSSSFTSTSNSIPEASTPNLQVSLVTDGLDIRI